MKYLSMFLIFIFSFLLAQCYLGADTSQLVIDEFSQYYNGKNEVVLKANDTIYGEDYEFNFNDLVENNSFNDGFIYKNGKLLFSTNEKISSGNIKLNIYESNVDGTNINLIFSKDGFKTFTNAFAINDYFYIEHNNIKPSNAEGIQIDRYTISTGEYVNVDNGKYADLFFYKKNEYCKYDVERITTIKQGVKDNSFTITDKDTGIKRIIDNDYLENTIYSDSLKKFKYLPRRFDIVNEHILLTYTIGNGSEYSYSHLIFEYNFEYDFLEFKSLVYSLFEYNENNDIYYIS